VNFDIDCLRTFTLVADTMSFSRAAQMVCRSQSTVSQQINKLERQVGKRLLHRRKGRAIEMTAEGHRLLQFGRKILQLNDEAYSSMADDALTGSVRLGVPLDFFGRNFTAWLAGFKTQNPMAALEVEANQSDNLLKRTERGEFDLAFFKQESGARRGTVVLREQLVWAAGRNFTPALDSSIPLILFPEGCAYRRFTISALRKSRRSWHISFVSPSFECLKTAVAENHGITVLARTLVSAPMREVGHQVGLPPLPTIELAYMYGHKHRSRVVTELTHYLANSLTNTDAPQMPHARTAARRVRAAAEPTTPAWSID
jgi:DNA-binding transcriptional LysR family regulator